MQYELSIENRRVHVQTAFILPPHGHFGIQERNSLLRLGWATSQVAVKTVLTFVVSCETMLGLYMATLDSDLGPELGNIENVVYCQVK